MNSKNTDCELIKQECEHRNITRLCHFTNQENVSQIFDTTLDPSGICSRDLLKQEGRKFSYLDKHRFDERTDLICCSIEYPNFLLLNKAMSDDSNVDWVVFLIESSYIWEQDTCFCSTNASFENGSYINSGYEEFKKLFDSPTETRGFERYGSHLKSVPTDFQAEVLVSGPISLDSILGIVVNSDEQKNAVESLIPAEFSSQVECKVCLAFFDREMLRNPIRSSNKTLLQSFA